MSEYNQPVNEKFDISRLSHTDEQFTRFATELVEQDLSPYADRSFLMQRLEGQSRLFRKYPYLLDEARSVIVYGEGNESIMELANKFDALRIDAAPETEKPINTYISNLSSANTLTAAVAEEIKVADFDNTRILEADNRLAAMIQLTWEKIAASFDISVLLRARTSAHVLNSLLEELHESTQSKALLIHGSYVKDILYSQINNRYNATKYLDALPGTDIDEIDEETARSDSLAVRTIFEEVRATQRYGVKLGYVQDEDIGSFVFHPPLQMMDVLNERGNALDSIFTTNNSVAEVVHSRLRDPKKLKLQVKKSEVEEAAPYRWTAASMQPLAMYFIGKDGELYIDRQCKDSLLELARTTGKYQAYRNQQAKILAHYYDATHAVIEEGQLARIATQSNPLPIPTGDPAIRKRLDSIEKLVIPRLKLHSEEGDTGDELEDIKSTRMVRQHNVVWHVRRLPHGWKASPAALSQAESLGLTLNPGETIVKEHQRGKRVLGEVVGHRLLKRS